MIKPLTVNLSYPSLDNIKEDKKTAFLLAGAYSGSHGELSAILQYFYHFLHFKRLGDENCAGVIMSIALAEMHHLEILGSLIMRLGIDPVFCTASTFCAEYYSAKNIRYSKDAKKMLIDDITAESVAIKDYEKLLDSIEDENVGAVISRIILDEQLHAKALKECFDRYNQ
ncbi:MAG: hypothetical protein E7340_01315 [Clostridiales bacterium]|nr:hypothetical protein [Clostridiales bacterium]